MTGDTWAQATGSAAFVPWGGHSSVVFRDNMWVIAGGVPYDFRNDSWFSTDGLTWKPATNNTGFPPRGGHTSVVYDDRMWVIGGTTWNFTAHSPAQLNDVWWSRNGSTWIRATGAAAFPGRDGHTSVVFDGKMWVIAGYHGTQTNDTWYSKDGISWTQATGSAAFPRRDSHSSVVFNNRMWVIGGHYYQGGTDFQMNDVWWSRDGITWTQATGSAAFPARRDHTSLVFDNKMWVIGGNDGNGDLNDVWYSSDGITWTQATGSAAFLPRSHFTSLVFNNRMWVIGGLNGISGLNDVWYTVTNNTKTIKDIRMLDTTLEMILENPILLEKPSMKQELVRELSAVISDIVIDNIHRG